MEEKVIREKIEEIQANCSAELMEQISFVSSINNKINKDMTTKVKKGKDTQYIYEFGCNMKIGDTLYYKKRLHEVVAITLVTKKEGVKPLYSIVDNSNYLSTVYENDPEIELVK